MQFILDVERITQRAQADTKNNATKVIVWDALEATIKDRIGLNRDARFAKACMDVLTDSDAFFDLRFGNFTLESVINSGPGLMFIGKPRKAPEVKFKIPFSASGRIMLQEDYDAAKAFFDELKSLKPEDMPDPAPIVERINTAMLELQALTGMELAPTSMPYLLVMAPEAPTPTDAPAPEDAAATDAARAETPAGETPAPAPTKGPGKQKAKA